MNKPLHKTIAACTVVALGGAGLSGCGSSRSPGECLGPAVISHIYPGLGDAQPRQVRLHIPPLPKGVIGIEFGWEHADPESLRNPRNRWYLSEPVTSGELSRLHDVVRLKVGDSSVRFKDAYAVPKDDTAHHGLSPRDTHFGPDNTYWDGAGLPPHWQQNGSQYTPPCDVVIPSGSA